LRGSTSGSPAIEIVEAAGGDGTGAADAGFACASLAAAVSLAGCGSASAGVEVAGAAGLDAAGCGCELGEIDSAGCDVFLQAARSVEQSNSITKRARAVSGERRKQSSKTV